MNLEFSGEVLFWRGPAPWYFVTVPEPECGELKADSGLVTYGGTGWKTSLFPKDGRYVMPVKARVRAAEGLEVGETVTVRLTVDV
jgi:hypothetical protein